MLLIFLNSKNWAGGVDELVLRFGNYLNKNNIDFAIASPADGWLRSKFPNERLITLEQLKSSTLNISHVFVPSIMGLTNNDFPWSRLKHSKISTYVVHPNDPFFCFFPTWDKLIKTLSYNAPSTLRICFKKHSIVFDEIFNSLHENRGIAVIDGATERALSYYTSKKTLKPILVPIPSPARGHLYSFKNEEALKIGYLGRMDQMKFSAIAPFLKQLREKEFRNKENVELYIVSSGPYLSKLISICKTINIKVIARSQTPNEEAVRWLAENCHVAAAMGTSALDLAGVGLPTVVIDPALGMFARRQQLFRFIHNCTDYTLGEYRDFPGYATNNASELSKLFHPEELKKASTQGYNHIKKEHNEARIFKKLCEFICNSNLEAAELELKVKRCMESFRLIRRRPIREFLLNQI